MKFTIYSERIVRDGFLKIVEADVAYDQFKGDPIRLIRERMERGHSVAVLLYERDTESFLFTKQFRYAIAGAELARGVNDAGWILELPAGGVKDGEDLEEAIRREIMEECGYEIDHLEVIRDMYVSPGGTSECIRLFYAETHSQLQIEQGGGALDEDEDIQLVRVHRNAWQHEDLIDGKTAFACFWYQQHKASY